MTPARASRSKERFALACLLGATACSVHAQAPAYPGKPLRWVVPFPPGGSTDLIGRFMGQELSRRIGQSVIIENRPGAGGIIGTEYVAKSAPDGYTLLQGSVAQFATFPSMYSKLPYDPQRDFVPLTLLQTITTVMVVTPTLPVKTVKDLVALAKRRPGELNFTASGVGTTTFLTGEMLKRQAGIDMVFINYKGSGPALTDVMAGFVQLMFEPLPSALPLVNSGRLRAIAVTSRNRSPALPQVPTLDESGFPGFDMVTWQGMFVPAATPAAIVERLNGELVKILRTPEISQKIFEQGGRSGRTPRRSSHGSSPTRPPSGRVSSRTAACVSTAAERRVRVPRATSMPAVARHACPAPDLVFPSRPSTA